MANIELNINPEILQWARVEAGYDIPEIANKLSISFDRYNNWEKEGKNVPLGKLKHLADCFKRQLAVFFLPYVPESISKPNDYRILKPAESKLSKEVLMVLRDVTYFCEISRDIKGDAYWNERYNWLAEIDRNKQDLSGLAGWLREKLNINIESQLSWGSIYEAYRIWRQSVESQLGVLVLQFPMPLKEIQGFCLTKTYPYAIVINSRLPYSNRIFTLFHELAHLINHHSGICLIENITQKQTEEWACNSFAGNFLIPDTAIITTNELQYIQLYANKMKVSREAYLRRLKENNSIPDDQFFHLLEQIKKTYPKEKAKKEIRIKREVISRASRGETFYNLILDAVNQNKISYTEASGMLGLKINRVLNEA
jgi:Zn-dependent peptidase ImmA (M78 family)/transcriptional regulator with XRE-family HTH domain